MKCEFCPHCFIGTLPSGGGLEPDVRISFDDSDYLAACEVPQENWLRGKFWERCCL